MAINRNKGSNGSNENSGVTYNISVKRAKDLGQVIMMARRKGWKILTLGLASGLCSLAGTAGIALRLTPALPADKHCAIWLAVILAGPAPRWLLAGRSLRGRFLARLAEIPYSRLRTPAVNGIWIVTIVLALASCGIFFSAFAFQSGLISR